MAQGTEQCYEVNTFHLLLLSLFLVFPARAPTDNLTDEELLLGIETGEGRGAGHQAGFQLALLASTLMIATIGGLISGIYCIVHVKCISVCM